MKKISVLIMFIITFGIASAAFSEIIPVLNLDPGENTVALSIVNNMNSDLADVSVKIDSDKLPSWLTFQGTPHAVDVRSGSEGSEKLRLIFEVAEAPTNAETQVPFTLVDALGNSWKYTATVRVSAGAPLQYALHTNYPNPFNPTTTISYALKDNQHTKLVVFNSIGQTIRTLVDSPQTAGNHTVRWDGRNALGEQVSSGVYFYRLEAGKFVKTKRMVLIE